MLTEGYEKKIPWKRFNNGFARNKASSLPQGKYAARSTLKSSGDKHMFLPYVAIPEGSAAHLSFAARGSFAAGKGVVAANSARLLLAPSAAWRGHTIDVTAAAKDEDGWVGVWWEHTGTKGKTTRMYIDNVQLYLCRPNKTVRLGGATATDTAVAVARQHEAAGSTVFLVNPGSGPALAAPALAGARRGPLLFTGKDSMAAAAMAELQRLAPSSVVVVGDTGAVSERVAQQVRDAGHDVQRIAGTNAYEAAANAHRETAPGAALVYVTATDPATSAVASSLAALDGAPLLFAAAKDVPATTIQALRALAPQRIVLVGDATVAPKAVLTALTQVAPTTRTAGSDAETTAASAAARYGTPTGSVLATTVTREELLVAAAFAGSRRWPLLLTGHQSLGTPARDRLTTMKEPAGYLVGSPAGASSLIRDQYGRTLP